MNQTRCCYWPCLFVALLLAGSTAVADPTLVTYDTIQTHPEMYVEGGTPEGECVGLAVSNHGEMGMAGIGGVNLDYIESGLDCGTRPEDRIYLWSGSPFVIVADDASGANARLTCSYGDTDGSKVQSWTPVDDLGGMNQGRGHGYSEFYDSIFTGRFVSSAGAIGMERVYYVAVPTDPVNETINFVIVRTKLYSADGLGHGHVTMGSVTDWNIPSDSVGINASGDDPWGLVYTQGTDTTGSEACQPNANRYATEAFLGSATAVDLELDHCAMNEEGWWGSWAGDQTLLRDTNLARDGSTVIDPPQPDARAWWDDLGANPGLHASETAQEMAQWMTVAHDYNLGAQDTLYFWTILTTVRNGSLADLEGQIATGTGWTFNDVLCCIPECANRCWGKVGDANGSGDDEPTIGDVSVMIDAKFITGTCDGIIPQLAEADINQSGEYNPQCNDITIGDISMLIDYLFIGGPNNVILPDCL